MGNRNRFREAHPSGALLEGLRYPRYGLLSGEAFEEVVLTTGAAPKLLNTDHGCQFNSRAWRDYLDLHEPEGYLHRGIWRFRPWPLHQPPKGLKRWDHHRQRPAERAA